MNRDILAAWDRCQQGAEGPVEVLSAPPSPAAAR
jgi:hypothetical protein